MEEWTQEKIDAEKKWLESMKHPSGRRGRPPLALAQRRIQTSVTLTLDALTYADKIGDGNVSAGLVACVTMCQQREADALAAIKAAAEARDQDTVASNTAERLDSLVGFD